MRTLIAILLACLLTPTQANVVFIWVSTGGPVPGADKILSVTGRLEVTDILAPLANAPTNVIFAPATGRLIDFRMDVHNFEGGIHIFPEHCPEYPSCDFPDAPPSGPGWYEFGFPDWFYDFDFDGSSFRARAGYGQLVQSTLYSDHMEVYLDAYLPCCDRAAVYGYWKRVPEPMSWTLLLLALAAIHRLKLSRHPTRYYARSVNVPMVA